jgi:hypothetical protein
LGTGFQQAAALLGCLAEGIAQRQERRQAAPVGRCRKVSHALQYRILTSLLLGLIVGTLK